MKKLLFLIMLLCGFVVNAVALETEANPSSQEQKNFVVLNKAEQAEFDKNLGIALLVLDENGLPRDFLGDALLSEATHRLELIYGWELNIEQKRALHYAVSTLIPAEYNKTMSFKAYSRLYADVDWQAYRVQCILALELMCELVKEIAFNTEDFGKWFQRASWFQEHQRRFRK